MKNINKAITFAKKETVLIVAMLLAVISAFFVTPDKAYASYIDFRTLGLLFSLMIVTEGCKGLGIFERSAKFSQYRISAFHSACGALLLFKYVHNK